MPPAPVRRFTVDEYHQMISAGILTEDDPVELLEGWITQKMPHNPRHDAVIGKTSRAFTRQLPSNWIVRVQCAITTADSEPEPDIAVVLGPDDRYFDHHPGPQEIGMPVEVADATVARDRGQKGRLYANSGIEPYWIVNLEDRRVEVYAVPSGSPAAYQQRKDYHPGDSVPLIVGGQQIGSIAVNDFLPPP
jgi:Uma2 family endonuclease